MRLSAAVRFPTYLGIGLLIGLAGLGMSDQALSFAHGTQENLDIRFVKTFTNDDGVVNESTKDPYDNGIDPGYDKRVARCTAQVVSAGLVTIQVSNGYPSYTCTFWTKVKNTGNRTVKRVQQVVTAPSELTVTKLSPHSCFTLKPDKTKYLTYSVHVEQSAGHGATYLLKIENKFVKAEYGC